MTGHDSLGTHVKSEVTIRRTRSRSKQHVWGLYLTFYNTTFGGRCVLVNSSIVAVGLFVLSICRLVNLMYRSTAPVGVMSTTKTLQVEDEVEARPIEPASCSVQVGATKQSTANHNQQQQPTINIHTANSAQKQQKTGIRSAATKHQHLTDEKQQQQK